MPNLNHVNRMAAKTVSGPYFSRQAAAAHLDVSVRTLERLFLEGGGPPAHRIGRKVVYSVAALDEWMAGRMVTSSSDATVRGLAA